MNNKKTKIKDLESASLIVLRIALTTLTLILSYMIIYSATAL